MASLNGDIFLLTSLLTVVLQEKSCDQKLKILAPFLHHPLDLTTLIPELSSQEVIDLSYLSIGTKGLIKLMQMATRCVQWNLTGIDLSGLTVAQVQSLNPDGLSVKSLELAGAKIKPDVRIALLAKLKCETWNLSCVDLSSLTVAQVQILNLDGLSVESIDLSKAQINPDVRIALLAKLKCKTWDLQGVDLSDLTMEQVQSLNPEGLSVKRIDLSRAQIKPDVLIAILNNFKCETCDLMHVDLRDLTADHVKNLNPDGLSLKSIDLYGNPMKSDVRIALLNKFKCETWHLLNLDLRDLTVDQVQRLKLDGLSVKKIELARAKIKPDVLIAILNNFKCETCDLMHVDLRDLTADHVKSLNPDQVSVKSIDLYDTHIKPDVRIALLAKLKH